MEDERRRLMSTIGQDLAQMLAPFLADMASSAKTNKDDLRDAMYEALGAVNARQMAIDTTPIITAIEQAMGNVYIPEPKVTVTTPSITVPEIKMPDEMNVKGWVSLMGVSLDNPLPVQIRDRNGNPVDFSGGVTSVGGGMGGGKGDYFTIKGFSQSAYAELTNPDGRLKVELPTGGSSLTDTELRASSVPVAQVSGATWSVSVNDIFRTTVASNLINSDDRLRVSLETGGSGLTDSELRATAVPVSQLSGAIWSTAVIDIFGSTAATSVFNADNRIRVSVETGGSGLTDAELRASSVPIEQVSGSNWSTSVTNTVTVSATDLDIRDLANATDSVSVYQVSGHQWSTSASQAGTWNIGTVTTVTGVTNSIAAALTDSSGIQYSGSNPVPVTATVSGSITSTVVTGPTVADAVDDGSAPVQVGGIARTANPTAVAGGDVVKSTHDDLGRAVSRPVQVRDLIATAYVSISNGDETVLLAAGASGVFHDLIYVLGTNNSDAAVTVALRDSTAGNIKTSIRIPANGTAGVSTLVPIPQDEALSVWTADLPDITGTTVTLSALFSKEV